MGVTNYICMDSEIIGEETAGVRTDYLTDALGSVTATVDQTGAIENTYRYKAYGDILAKTGTASNPAFTWVGSKGYRQINSSSNCVYIRARHYYTIAGMWTSIDKYWPDQPPYIYARANPSTFVDPTGNKPKIDPNSCIGVLNNDDLSEANQIRDCYKKNKLSVKLDPIACLKSWCSHGSAVNCSTTGTCQLKDEKPDPHGTYPSFCYDCNNQPVPIKQDTPCGHTYCSQGSISLCSWIYGGEYDKVCPGNQKGNQTPIDTVPTLGNRCNTSVNQVILHELLGHLCGDCPGPDAPGHPQKHDKVASCAMSIVGCTSNPRRPNL